MALRQVAHLVEHAGPGYVSNSPDDYPPGFAGGVGINRN